LFFCGTTKQKKGSGENENLPKLRQAAVALLRNNAPQNFQSGGNFYPNPFTIRLVKD
jgi:hypothetical protein